MTFETITDRSTSALPVVSVLVASYNSKPTIAAALDSLAAQQTRLPFEVIVIDSSNDETPVFVAQRFPAVRLLHTDQRRYAGEARNLGAAEASGRILALMDADCTVPPNWIDRIVAAHARADEIIGGVVENGNPESYAGWAYYFTEFNQWLPDRHAGPIGEVPGCSMTIKRDAYDRHGPFMVGGYCSDTQFVWRLAAEGKQPYLDPSIRVAHMNPERLSSILRHQPEHGRHFARLRSREQLTRAGALLRAGSSVLLPFILFLRAGRHVFRDSHYGPRFVLAAPLTLAAMIGWSWGEASGYVASALNGDAGSQHKS